MLQRGMLIALTEPETSESDGNQTEAARMGTSSDFATPVDLIADPVTATFREGEVRLNAIS